jgi:[FeFe] hydrogenase (group B1/B3)
MEISRFILKQQKPSDIDTLPFNIIDMGHPTYRCCSYRELSIVKQRIRLAFGLPLEEERNAVSAFKGIEKAFTKQKIIETPLVSVIRAACEKCPEDMVIVTDTCQACMAHPCSIVCPRNAISFPEKNAVIDQEKCIKCMKCVQVCPYAAITRMQRPCAEACGVQAIDSDEEGFARINQEICVSCGLCTVSCPFAAISDKSEIVQILHALIEENRDGKLHAIVAPSFTGQFGNKVRPEQIFSGIRQLGFDEVMEVAYGADCDTLQLASRLLQEEQSFLGTSCCPSWVMTACSFFPEFTENITDSYTPMVETAKIIKEKSSHAKVVFIGPCIAKKYEALTDEVSGYVDYVLTFEELAALFVAFGIDLSLIDINTTIHDASTLGRGYAMAGGVGGAIIKTAEQQYGATGIKFEKADTLLDCREMLKRIQSGESVPDLVEGMACPGGCIGGPGTLAPLSQTKRQVRRFSEATEVYFPQCKDLK